MYIYAQNNDALSLVLVYLSQKQITIDTFQSMFILLSYIPTLYNFHNDDDILKTF